MGVSVGEDDRGQGPNIYCETVQDLCIKYNLCYNMINHDQTSHCMAVWKEAMNNNNIHSLLQLEFGSR